MNKIKLLTEHEAQKIAAGEVVERPVHIVKELIENSIDAGATTITLHIKKAGKQLIRVVDNGCGMSPEDARMCFVHHATSKLTSVDDLMQLNTFGFRGEALASMAAVGKITLITKEADVAEGTQLAIEKNEVIEQKPVACQTGTDIAINDLFYNIPARRKFLRTDETEWRQINQLFQALCFDYPHIHFKLISEGTTVHNCPSADSIATRITQLWQHTGAQQMIELKSDNKQSAATISGMISNHQYSRYDRNQLYFFVNKRWVKNYTLSRALIKGYMNVLPQGKYPAGCIFIDIPTDLVDINIHPRKEEVQFLNPRTIERAISESVKQTLEHNLSSQIKQPVAFSPSYESYAPEQQRPAPFPSDIELPPLNQQPWVYQEQPEPFGPQETITESFEAQQKSLINEQPTTTAPENSFAAGRIIGQHALTYILIERSDGLFVVDQHAAQERILYELFANRFKDLATVSLIFPQMISLSPEDLSLIEPYLSLFTDNGIAIEPFGQDQLIISSTPVHLKNVSLADMVKQAVGWINEQSDTSPEQLFQTLHKKLRAQMACKAAVKAGDSLDMQQMEQLLRDLANTPNNLTCPHGRPTGWLLNTYEIEKRFKRIGK